MGDLVREVNQVSIGIRESPLFEKKVTETETGTEELRELYDDGHGTASVSDYFAGSKAFKKPDNGPPRWFCPAECRAPIKDSPLLFFLPGIDGTGMGLVLHQKSLGRVFEVRCLHIPVNDRTPFEGLVKFVGESVKFEHALNPDRPIYLVGDSFGGCLALAVAACNRSIDLILILVNPATSFSKSQLQPLLPLLEILPSNLHITVSYLLSFTLGDPVKMAMTKVVNDLPVPEKLNALAKTLTSLLPNLGDLADIIPRETLLWKLKLLKSAASFANARLHAVEAEVLVLTSGKDNLMPSGEEGDRLWTSLKDCRVRYFKDSGHTLLLEDGVNLLTLIKGKNLYRRSRQRDYVVDFLPPTLYEYRKTFYHDLGLLRRLTCPAMFSTMGDGMIVKGLAGVPDEGPVLLVGYHMLMGFEIISLCQEFLKEKKISLRGLAHPLIFSKKMESSRKQPSVTDVMPVFGALPVSATSMYRLFSSKSFVLLYPGGASEALHLKGEGYKLFWPDQPEFVRMAARFGVKIVPFGVVGEDDVAELAFDYNDQMKIPPIRDWIEGLNTADMAVRPEMEGDMEQKLHIPGLLPKLPGRFYYLFGKPIETKGKYGILKDRDNANVMYLQIKSEVERIISYLKEKREEDPYRSIVSRTLFEASWGFTREIPTFEP